LIHFYKRFEFQFMFHNVCGEVQVKNLLKAVTNEEKCMMGQVPKIR